MTDVTVEALRACLEAARVDLLALVRDLPHEELVRRPPGEVTPGHERWATRDILWHIGDREGRAVEWAEGAFEGRMAGDGSRRRLPAAVNTLGQLLEWLSSTRARTDALLARLDESALQRPRRGAARQGAFVKDEAVAIGPLLASCADHERAHIRQIASVLGRAGPSVRPPQAARHRPG